MIKKNGNVLRTIGYAAIAALSGLLLNIAINHSGLMELFPAYATDFEPVLERYDLYTGILIFVIIAPLAEEAVFRLFLFNFLEKKLGFMPSAVISSLVFGIYHMNVIQFIYAFLMGLLFAYFYHKDHRFAVPYIMHLSANAAVYLLL